METKYLDALEDLDSMIEDFMRLNYEHVNISDIHENAKICGKVVDYLKELKAHRERARKPRCGECGSKDIKLQSVWGKYYAYRQYSGVRITTDLHLLCCQDCDNEILGPGDCKRMDEAIEETLKTYGERWVKK